MKKKIFLGFGVLIGGLFLLDFIANPQTYGVSPQGLKSFLSFFVFIILLVLFAVGLIWSIQKVASTIGSLASLLEEEPSITEKPTLTSVDSPRGTVVLKVSGLPKEAFDNDEVFETVHYRNHNPEERRLVDLHFEISEKIPQVYKRRTSDATALEKTIQLCIEQIKIGPQIAAIMAKEYQGSPLPTHRGFEQLAIIRDKQGDYDTAVKVCQTAQQQGWNGDWEARIERYSRKLQKTKKQNTEWRPKTIEELHLKMKSTTKVKPKKSKPITAQNLAVQRVVFVDTETTGLSPDAHEVIEIAAIKIDGGNSLTFHSFLIPHGEVGATEIHGYTEKFLMKNGNPQDYVFQQFKEFVGDLPVAGHNVSFDVRFLEANARKHGVILKLNTAFDTLSLCRKLITGMENYKLETLCQSLRLNGDGQSYHNALDDVLSTIRLATHLKSIS